MPGHYGKMQKPKMTYQQYVKARSQHLKQQGTTLKGTERMKQIANEWNGKGKGIAMAGGSFMDILKQLPGLIMGGQLKTEKGEGFSDFLDGMTDAIGKTSSFLGGELMNKKEPKMKGKGVKSVLKKVAKYGLPLAGTVALLALGNKGIDVQGGFDSRNFQPFVEVDMERNTPMMDENEITGFGLKKKGKKMTGKGTINKIGQIAKKFGIPLLVATAILASGAVAQNEAELLLNTVLNTQRGGGAKLDKFKKMAKKYGVPLATVLGVLVAGRNLDLKNVDLKNIAKMAGDTAKNVAKETGDFIKLSRAMMGFGKKGKKKMTKKQMKQMEGEGFFDFIGDAVGSIQDGIKGVFGNPTNATDVITKTAGMTLSALPFIL
jgi:hypothetical protein